MTREQAEQRALELHPTTKNQGKVSISKKFLRRKLRESYLQCYDDMQKEIDELRVAAQKVVMYHREKFHESTQINKSERFNKSVYQLEKTLSKQLREM